MGSDTPSSISPAIASIDPAIAFSPQAYQWEYATAAKLFNYPDEPPPGRTSAAARARRRPACRVRRRDDVRVPDPLRFSLLAPVKRGGDSRDGQGLDRKGALARVGPELSRHPFRGCHQRRQRLPLGDRPAHRGPTRERRYVDDPPDQTRRRPPASARAADVLGRASPHSCDRERTGETDSFRRALLRRLVHAGSAARPAPESSLQGSRPHTLDEFVYTFGQSADQAAGLVKAGQADYTTPGLPPAFPILSPAFAPGGALDRTYGAHGISKPQRFFLTPTLSIGRLAMNTSRGIFRDARLRRAVAYALDRSALAAQLGPLLGRPSDQYLPLGMPGSRDTHIYPLTRPNLARAKALARGRGGRAMLWTCDLPVCLARAEIIRRSLAPLGIHVTVKSDFPVGAAVVAISKRGANFDLPHLCRPPIFPIRVASFVHCSTGACSGRPGIPTCPTSTTRSSTRSSPEPIG